MISDKEQELLMDADPKEWEVDNGQQDEDEEVKDEYNRIEIKNK